MSNQLIYISILVASLGTYFCRAFGVFSAKNITPNSPIFNWIRCVSIAVISAVITRIILFPAGMLEDASLINRVICTLIALVIFFSLKKNVILSVVTSATCFVILNKFI